MVGLPADLSPAMLVILLTSIILSIYYILFTSRIKFYATSPKQASEQYPIVGALAYFSKKWDFYRRSSAESPTGNFSFYLGQHAVIGLAGETGREAFYNSRQLGLTQGSDRSPVMMHCKIPANPTKPVPKSSNSITARTTSNFWRGAVFRRQGVSPVLYQGSSLHLHYWTLLSRYSIHLQVWRSKTDTPHPRPSDIDSGC